MRDDEDATGVFFYEQNADSVAHAILRFEAIEDEFSPEAIQAHARQFDTSVFVEKLTLVVDAGTIVHPDGANAQVEGAALWGLSMALHEGTEFVNGSPRDTNLDTYTPLRMGDVPEIKGLSAGAASSVEPMGVLVGATGEPGPKPSGDVKPSGRPGEMLIPPTCA